MAGTASLLLFVLAGAFAFAYRCHYTSYLASRMEGRQLLFLVTSVAVGLLLLSRCFLLVASLLLWEPLVSFIGRVWMAIVSPFGVPEVLATFFGAFVLGPVLAGLVNAFYGAERASTDIIEKYGGEREKFLFAAMESEDLVLVTLRSRKVYVGWPLYTPDPRRETKDFRLFPAASGYRDEQTLELKLTTQYSGVYERIEAGEYSDLQVEDFDTILPLEEVESANLFSLEIDQDLFKIPPNENNEVD